MGFRDSPAESALSRFDDAHRAVLSDVRGRFEKLFYRPMIESLAEGAASRLSRDALKERLRVLGFRDVERAATILDGLISGTSRRARLFRVVTPALLRSLATSPLPDDGLLSFLRLGEALEDRPEVLGALRDHPPSLALAARVLGSGRVLGEMLLHVPDEVSTIADTAALAPSKERSRMVREAKASLEWREPDARLDGLRRFKRRELFRIALKDLAGESDVATVGASLSDLADACLEAALDGESVPFAVIGMGRLGGRELNYASDIDVMFVHEGQAHEGERTAERLVKAIGEVTPEGQAFRIDAALRPEGKAGALARSLDSYLEYYERWAKPWEHQALIKARFAAGDKKLGERLVDETRRWAYPARLPDQVLTEIRHLKARMERERIPRRVAPRLHIKMGPGGMADIEFAVQLVQLRHAHQVPALRVANTVEALAAATQAELMTDTEGTRLTEAYLFLARLRDRLFFMTGKPVDVLPGKPEDLEALGIAMGYADQPRQELENAYLRLTRRARQVAERLIYG